MGAATPGAGRPRHHRVDRRAAPGGGTFGTHFGVPVINNSGQVAFTAFTSQPADTDTGVYQGTSSADLAAVTRLGGGVTTLGHTVAQNGGGVVVFAVNSNTGIVARNPGNSPQFLIQAGDTVQPIGGGTMYTLASVSDPVINAKGQVAYVLGANGGPPALAAVSAGGNLVAYTGQGDLLNGQIFNLGAVSIDDLGDVVFFATASYQQGPPFDIPTIATSAVSAGIVDFALLGGTTLTNGEKVAIDFSNINGTSTPMISKAGIVFRSASCAGFVCPDDVFLLQGSTLTIIARTGDAAPGGGTFAVPSASRPYLVFDEPQINDNGSIVFVGDTDGGPGSGVYRFTQAHGLEAMALQGQAPYAAAVGFRNAVINNHDVVAFQAFDGSAGNHRGVYITDGTTTVRAGSDNFFGNEGSSTGAFSRAFFGSPGDGLSPLNDKNQVTFVNSVGSTSQSVMKFTVDPKWVQPGSGAWDTSGNWTFSVEPASDSIVTIAGQAAGPLVVTGPAAAATVSILEIGTGPNVAELDLQSSGPLTSTAELIVFSKGALGGTGTLTTADFEVESGGNVTGALTLNAPVFFNAGTMNGTFTINGDLDNSNVMNGDFTVNGNVTNEATGSITGNQMFNGNVTNDGTIGPGHSPGTVHVTGDLTLETTPGPSGPVGSELDIQIGGPNPGTDYDVITVTGNVKLAGKLVVTFINGFTPAANQTFQFLQGGTVTGTFDAVSGADVQYGPAGIMLSPPTALTAIPKALVKCGAAITKAGTSYTSARLKTLDGCVAPTLKCVEETAAGAKRDACVAKANTSCGKDLAKVAALATKLTGAIGKACTGAVSVADALNAAGLGYSGVGDACTNDFSTALSTFATIEQCVLRAHACRGETILDAQAPRTKELMLRVAGIAPADLDALACLPDHNGTGADLGAPKGAGKAVTKCEGTLTKAGDTFLAKQMKSLGGCVGAVFACVIEKPGVTACITKAHAKCDKAFAAIDAAATALENAVTKSCAPPAVAFDDLSAAAGVDVGVLGSDCAALGVASLVTPADYATCLVHRETCNAEDLVRFEAPRADDLLGLVGRSLSQPFCPAS